jgi:hypothetical protein
MAARLFNSCRMFNLYCHGTGFNPQPYIESIVADYSLLESDILELLSEKYKDDIEKGIHLRMVTGKK